MIGVYFMNLTPTDDMKNREQSQDTERMLDNAIADLKAGRELPLKEAFQKVSELRKQRRIARL